MISVTAQAFGDRHAISVGDGTPQEQRQDIVDPHSRDESIGAGAELVSDSLVPDRQLELVGALDYPRLGKEGCYLPRARSRGHGHLYIQAGLDGDDRGVIGVRLDRAADQARQTSGGDHHHESGQADAKQNP